MGLKACGTPHLRRPAGRAALQGLARYTSCEPCGACIRVARAYADPPTRANQHLAGEIVEELERLFKDHANLCGEVFAIPRARTPVIKLVWTPTGTKVARVYFFGVQSAARR